MENGDPNLPDDARLARLAPLYDILPVPLLASVFLCAVLPNDRAMQRWPNFPAAALPASGRVAMGCGISLSASLGSGLGEAAELAQSCIWGDEVIVRATQSEMAGLGIPAGALNGFSTKQTRDRDAENRWLAGYDWVPPHFAQDCAMGWIAAQDVGTGRVAYVPADTTLIGRRERGDPEAVSIADSNGCASGPTIATARLSALLELIERDAAARWWFGRRNRPTLYHDLLGEWPVLCDGLLGRKRMFRLFDITSDIGLPVVAAVSFEPDGTKVALGFSAKLRAQDAARSAVLEMLAVETTMPPWRHPGDDPAMIAWLRQANANATPLGASVYAPPPEPVGQLVDQDALATVIGIVLKKNCCLLFVDHSRPCWDVPVARAISPDLCQLRPRFGRSRLFAPDERDLAPIALWPDPRRPLLIPM